MAGIDYTIPGQFKGIQIESPMNAMAQAMQLRNLQDSFEMNALKRQEYERGRGEENELRRLFADKTLDKSSPEFINQLYAKAPGLAPGIEKNILERGKTASEIRYKDAQASAQAAEALSKKLDFHQKVFNPLAVTTEDQAAAHAAAFYDNPDFAPYATKMMTREQAIAKSRELFKTDKNAWLKSQLTLSGDKILEATERREKELRDRAEKSYPAYQLSEFEAGREPLPIEEYIAQRMQPTAAAAPTTAPAPAPAPEMVGGGGEVITLADGTRQAPAVTKTEKKPISAFGPDVHPLVPSLIAGGNKEMATIVQEGHKASGALRQINDTFKEIERLETEKPQGYEARIKALRNYIKVVSTEGPGTKVQVGVKLPEGVKAVDQKYAQDYLDWSQGGGADAAANMGQIKFVLDRLAAGENLTGPSIGLAPDFFNALVNPQALNAKQAVEEVVQRNLRAVLGAQFTQVEGERLISRAFDARLSPQENVKRLRKLFLQMQTAAQQKQAMAEYYEANETLRGYKGKQPKMQDFFDVLSTPDAPPKGSVDVMVDGRMQRFKSQADLDAYKAKGGKVDK